MRISTWLRLAALFLIVGSLSASAARGDARPPAAEPKTPVYHEDFTGIRKTEMAARKDALDQACAWVEEQRDLGWAPDAEYLLNHKMVQFCDPEDKEFEEPMGVMKVVKMQLDINADQVRDIQKHAQQLRMKERQKYSLLALVGVMGLLGVVGGYMRMEEATKGYYTRLLRLAAIGIVIIIVASLFVVG